MCPSVGWFTPRSDVFEVRSTKDTNHSNSINNNNADNNNQNNNNNNNNNNIINCPLVTCLRKTSSS